MNKSHGGVKEIQILYFDLRLKRRLAHRAWQIKKFDLRNLQKPLDDSSNQYGLNLGSDNGPPSNV